MIITFCGHAKLNYSEAVKKNLHKELDILINSGADKFLLGGYGGFDIISAITVRELKKTYPHITSTLVIPYLDCKHDFSLYDDSVYPSLENIPKRYAIVKRNEWMINQCDILISGVINTWGGAYTTQEYAKRKNKKIIHVI